MDFYPTPTPPLGIRINQNLPYYSSLWCKETDAHVKAETRVECQDQDLIRLRQIKFHVLVGSESIDDKILHFALSIKFKQNNEAWTWEPLHIVYLTQVRCSFNNPEHFVYWDKQSVIKRDTGPPDLEAPSCPGQWGGCCHQGNQPLLSRWTRRLERFW